MVDDPERDRDLGPDRDSEDAPSDDESSAGKGGRLAVLGRLRGRVGRPRLRLPIPRARTFTLRGRELSINPRLIVAVVVVGLVGFVAGSQFGGGTAGRTLPTASAPAVAASPTEALESASPVAVSVAGSSAMAAWFAPDKLVAGSTDASSCVVDPGPSGTGGVWWQRVWFAHCHLAAARRDRAVDGVGRAVTDGFVATGLTGTGSYFVSNRNGAEIGHWTYEATGLDGTIQLLRYDAGTDLELVFIISEHAKD